MANLVGTVRGATPCARCHHARMRHLDHGRGECATSWAYQEPTLDGKPGPVKLIRCTCPGFKITESR